MASTVIKKNSLCRYFIRYGDCFHGENCRYIHAYPPQSTPQPQSVPIEPPPTPVLVTQTQNAQPQPPAPQQQGYSKNKLVCSLKSDLPNEIDFAMQVSTLLANTDNFSWSKDYQLVDAVCSSLHVYVCICGDSSNCFCYPRFWRRILQKQAANQELQLSTLAPDVDPSTVEFDSLKEHDFKDQTKIYKRIKTVAELIRQFSMTCGMSQHEREEQNVYNYLQMKKKKLKASPTLLKFVSLLLFCDELPLNLIGLDILSNTASKLSKISDTTDDPICFKLIQTFQEFCVDNICCQEGDINIVNRSIEVISKLISSSSRRVSSNIINLIVEKNLVYRIEQFLTSHYDVTLFLTALECCYRISRYQAHLLTGGRSKYLMKILVNLLNCDDKRYFTPSALKRIKLVDEDDLTVYNLTPLTIPTRPQLKQPQPSQNHQVVEPNPIKSQTESNSAQPAQNEAPNVKEYRCEWDGCEQKFLDYKKVYTHVFECHVGPLAQDTISPCLWSSPNGSGPGCLTKRPKYSLLTHLNDFHCNQVALERALNRSQPVKPPEHPGYAPNAALLAIKRHANSHMDGSNGNRNSSNQSPLSISVRLTSALILRNLATESAEMKQALENHEPLLSEICMSNGRDESKIIAECLSLISRD